MPIPEERRRFAAALCRGLDEAGFRHVRKGFHRSIWSTPEVESFVAVSYAQGGGVADPYYGIRNARSQAFAFASLSKYGGSFYGSLTETKTATCLGSYFSIEARKPAYKFGSFLNPFGENAYRFAVTEIIADVETYAVPHARLIVTLERLLERLLLDREPFAFFRGNPALRVAAICSVAQQLGNTRLEVASLARPFLSRLRNLFLDVGPDAYLGGLLADLFDAAVPSGVPKKARSPAVSPASR